MAVRCGAGLDRDYAVDIYGDEMTNEDLARLDELILCLSQAMINASLIRKSHHTSPPPQQPADPTRADKAMP